MGGGGEGLCSDRIMVLFMYYTWMNVLRVVLFEYYCWMIFLYEYWLLNTFWNVPVKSSQQKGGAAD